MYDYIGLKEFDEIHALDTAMNKGFIKGVEQGIEQKNRIATIKMADKGFDVDTIAQVLDISIDEVKRILELKV